VAKSSAKTEQALPASQFAEHVRAAELPACVVLAGAERWFREQAAAALIARVFPGGSTNLSGGWLQGLSHVKALIGQADGRRCG
jgi:hypothetical protein